MDKLKNKNLKYYFITVNYKSSNLIEKWASSIFKFVPKAELIIIDNFSSLEEREMVSMISKKINFELIESENEGYSSGLNKGLEKVLSLNEESVIFCCNLDIEFKNIPNCFPTGKKIHIPKIIENGRKNRNPFLTRFQKYFIPLYKIAAKKRSIYLYFIAIVINKIAGIFSSKIWAIHGSLFCFNSSLIDNINNLPFNSDSFLYGEEYEFASFVEKSGGEYIKSEIIVFHDSHSSTSELINNNSNFMKYWAPSFLNFTEKKL